MAIQVHLDRGPIRVYKASKTGERGSRLFLSVVHSTATKLFHNLPSETSTATPLVSIDSTGIMSFEASASTKQSQGDVSSAETSEDEAGSTMSQVTCPRKGATFVPEGYNRYKNYRKEFIREWDECESTTYDGYKTLVDKYGKWTVVWSKRYFDLATSPILTGPEDREAQLQTVLRNLKDIEAEQHDDEKLATSTWQTFEDDELE